jgi:hypothetical protein
VGGASDGCRPKLHRWPFSFSTSCHSRLPCASHLSRAGVRTDNAYRLCLLEARVSGGLQCVQTHAQSVRYVLEGERKLRLRSCQATYQFPHVTLAACREQAFLCFQKHYTWRFSRRNHLWPPKTSYKSRLRGERVGFLQPRRGNKAP